MTMKTTVKTTTKTLIALAALASLTAMTAPTMASAFEPGARFNVTTVDFRDQRPDHRPDHRPDQRFARHDDDARAQLNTRIIILQSRLDDGRRSHQLNRFTYGRLNARLDDIIAMKRDDERSGRGLSRDDVATLNARLDRLSSQLHFDRRG
jgi:hypothetical protein